MSISIPSPKSVGIFLLATTGTIYGLFETLSYVGEVDTFLSNPFISITPSVEPTVVLEAQQASKPDDKPQPVPAPSTPTVIVSLGTEPSSTATNTSATVVVGLEDTKTGESVTTTPTPDPAQGTAPKPTTLMDTPSVQPTEKSVVVSTGTKPTPKPKAKPAPKAPIKVVVVKKVSSKVKAPKAKRATSANTNQPKPASKPISLSSLSDWWYKDRSYPTSKQIVNANGEDEYDEKEIRERFARSKWNAIWIQHIDYMLLAPNDSKVWKDQAEKMKDAWDNASFAQYFDTAEQAMNIPLFGRFYLKERYPLKNGKHHPTDPYMVPWNGPNLAAACKSLTEWTPNGAWWMSARGEIWDAAWNFCVKPSKIARGIKPQKWLYQ